MSEIKYAYSIDTKYIINYIKSPTRIQYYFWIFLGYLMTLNCNRSYILKRFENVYKWNMCNDLEGGCGGLFGAIVLEFAWKYRENLWDLSVW
jgi:hypothetical protein